MKFSAGVIAIASLAASVAADKWATTTTTTTTTPAGTWADWTTTTTTTTKGWSKDATTTAKPDHWTTSIVSAITTYVPEACTFTHAGKVYSISAATTLTITDCPCTVSVPVWTKTSTSCSETVSPVSTGGWGNAGSTAVAPTWAATTAAAGSPSWTAKAAASTYTGAAPTLVANVGAGLMGVGAFAALLL